MTSTESPQESRSTEDSAAPDTSVFGIADLRKRLSKIQDPAELELWCGTLRQDPRVGARRLAETSLRRLKARRDESMRLEKLFEHRALLLAQGCRAVAGVDEVGVGPLAGPVVAAAVVLPSRVDLPGLNDSKKLSPKARQRLDAAIREQALGFALGEVEPLEIDRVNILQASLEAMRRAVSALAEQLPLDHLLVDARRVPGVAIPQTPLVHGDSRDGSIAAASIVAKVYRDGVMKRLGEEYPGYGLERHMGYGTAEHMAALDRIGTSPVHRRSFAPVAAAIRRPL